MPTTASTPSASRSSISCRVVMPPAAVTRRAVARRGRPGSRRVRCRPSALRRRRGCRGTRRSTGSSARTASTAVSGSDVFQPWITTLAAAAVDGGDDAFGADGVGQRLANSRSGRAVLEQRRAGDDCCAPAASSPARARPCGCRRRRGTTARAAIWRTSARLSPRAHRGVEIDDLHLRKAREPAHPREDVVVADREPLALHELHDGAVLEIDGRNQHRCRRRVVSEPHREYRVRADASFSARTLVSA